MELLIKMYFFFLNNINQSEKLMDYIIFKWKHCWMAISKISRMFKQITFQQSTKSPHPPHFNHMRTVPATFGWKNNPFTGPGSSPRVLRVDVYKANNRIHHTAAIGRNRHGISTRRTGSVEQNIYFPTPPSLGKTSGKKISNSEHCITIAYSSKRRDLWADRVFFFGTPGALMILISTKKNLLGVKCSLISGGELLLLRRQSYFQ